MPKSCIFFPQLIFDCSSKRAKSSTTAVTRLPFCAAVVSALTTLEFCATR